MRDELHPIADAEYRCDVEEPGVGARSIVVVHGARSATENDDGRLPLPNPLERPRGRVNLRVNARLTNPPGDELSELRAVVEYEYPATHGGSTRALRGESLPALLRGDRGWRRWAVRRAIRRPRPG